MTQVLKRLRDPHSCALVFYWKVSRFGHSSDQTRIKQTQNLRGAEVGDLLAILDG